MDVKSYTWSQFKDAIHSLLPTDYGRIGSVPDLIDRWTRQSVIRVQNFIKAYQAGHETLYLASDFVLEGYSCIGTLPPGGKIEEAYLVLYCKDANGRPIANCRRYPLALCDWSNRMALVHGNALVNGGVGLLAIDPQTRRFYVYPGIRDCQVVSVFWTGLKVEFRDDELTPFDEQMTQVVADYVSAYVKREVDKDLPLFESYMESHKNGLSLLYLDARGRGRPMLSGPVISIPAGSVAPPDPQIFQIIHGSGAPTSPPPNPQIPYIYIDDDTGAPYTWNVTKQSW